MTVTARAVVGLVVVVLLVAAALFAVAVLDVDGSGGCAVPSRCACEPATWCVP